MIPPVGSQTIAPRERQPPHPAGAAAVPPPALAWLRRIGLAVLALAIVGVGAATGLARYGGSYDQREFTTRLALPGPDELPKEPAARAERLAQRLASPVRDREVYVTVDSYRNRLRIYRGDELLREAVCSTGSGVRLKDPRNGKEWIFDTPQGELKILRKVKNPVWVKPDWAFIEEGYEPPKNLRDRVDDFSLGGYGLYMRDGYIIHGTIFQTLLGRRVTHGCIRLGDEDLEFAYKTVPVGARVFLY